MDKFNQITHNITANVCIQTEKLNKNHKKSLKFFAFYLALKRCVGKSFIMEASSAGSCRPQDSRLVFPSLFHSLPCCLNGMIEAPNARISVYTMFPKLDSGGPWIPPLTRHQWSIAHPQKKVHFLIPKKVINLPPFKNRKAISFTERTHNSIRKYVTHRPYVSHRLSCVSHSSKRKTQMSNSK